MFKKIEDTKEYKAGYEACRALQDGFIRSCLEKGEAAMKASLEYRERALQEGLAALQKEKSEWEETKARYVLEQLRIINGGR
jgi:hypothetical protein